MRSSVSSVIGLVIVLAGSTARAQTLTAGLKLGIDFSSLPKAGEVIDQIAGQQSSESSAKIGVLLGGFVTMPITDRWAFEPELQFVMKGVKLDESASGGGGTFTASTRYLEFPLLIRYTITQGTYIGYVLAGPTFAVKAGTSATLERPDRTAEVDIDPAIRTFDGGIAVGGGVEYRRYFFELRYTQGLSDVAADEFPHPDSLRNRVFAFAAGVRFR
jgi:hypothetical protein